MARWRVPFAHDLCTESLGVEESSKRRYGVLVHAVPILAEVVAFEESFQPADPFRFHRGDTILILAIDLFNAAIIS